MGKDQESLDLSREIRQYLISKWGRIPKSVWEIDWSVKYIELSKSYNDQQKINTEKVGKDFALSGTGARHGQLSRFSQDILQFLVKFLTPENLPNGEQGYFDNGLPTIIDPFAGHNCLPAGTKILIPDGVKNIEDMQIGERVLTHTGNYHTVLDVFSHENSDNMFKLDVAGAPNMLITGGHPVLSISTKRCPYHKNKAGLGGICLFDTCHIAKTGDAYIKVANKGNANYRGERTRACERFYQQYNPRFSEVSKLKAGDFVCFPINRSVVDIESIKITDFVEPKINGYTYTDDYIITQNKYKIRVNNTIKINNDFMRLCGYYIADGGLRSNASVGFTFNIKETEYAKDVVELLRNVFGIDAVVKEELKYNVLRVGFCCTIINHFLRSLFSHRAHNKHLPEFMMSLPNEKQAEFIKGYFRGDGCRSAGKSGVSYTAVTVSTHLAAQIKQILLRLGTLPSVLTPKMTLNGDGGKWGIIHRYQAYYIILRGNDIVTMDRIMGTKTTSRHTQRYNAFFHGDYACYKVMSVEKLDSLCRVYNLEVSTDNSYTVLQGALHNSRAEGTWRCNRNYVGWDCSARHNVMNRKVKELLEIENNQSMLKREALIEFIEGDSRKINYDSQFDFSITSPPFYDIEDYGDEPEQLGKQKTYDEFLSEMQIIFNNVYRALKPNTYIAVETNDFRRKGVFHTYHADMITMLKTAGFIMHDMIICDYGSSFLEAFLSDIEAQKITGKQHSYIAVARKLPVRIEKREQVRERLAKEVIEKREAGEIDGDGHIIDPRQVKLF